ncbi:4'-phosphopantetheinyl transferase superfamily protein [Stutzerimonas stutzeri]|uniref:4'-phosphopantetheinyl transferase family protein n=1 Tax=Stutzerimonas sp. S1 TaxID=3030652 RepID=UPI0022240BBA|nr:4'-phosphopantetheinyl transferase superfamily protein [Stutzerimonas sp. S1]MCW3148975.1 4'-phosphopantetheinyl transferase superfamily protein [Stutzerimonas sp. S1]
MTTLPPLPRCCTGLNDHWPLPRALPGVRLLSTRFDPALLDAEDFPRWGIPLPNGVSKRQAEFLAGRLCARQALQGLTGVPSVPSVAPDRSPCWPAGVVGSITHGAGWAGVVVARRNDWLGLGLDIEKRLPTERADRLVGEILTANELLGYADLSAARRAQRVTLTFSLKESLFKALYPLVNQRFYFQDAELLAFDDSGYARLRLLTDLSAQWRRGVELEGQFCEFDGYLLSLVSVPL